MPLSPILDAVKDHFFAPACLSRVVAITQAEVQVEGWFKAELIWLFGELEKGGAVNLSWTRESPTGRGGEKVDFKVELANTVAVIEIKAALCGPQKGQKWKLRDYVCAEDISRLVGTQAASRYLLCFAYPAPTRGDWPAVVSKIATKLPGVDVNIVRCDDSPGGELCIGWLEASTQA